jgi:glycosyltransferase involved in cell wall biosynthesis
MRQKILVRGPILTQSGYGEQSRFAVRALRSREDLFEIFIMPVNWGQTGWVSLDNEERAWIDSRIAQTHIHTQQGGTFDISLQITIPNEWEKIAPINVGYTAGIETTKVAPEWLQKTSLMDKIIVVSNHSKDVFANTVYQATNQQTGETVELRNQTPISVVNFPIRDTKKQKLGLKFDYDFNYLAISQWGPRKNFDNLINWFIEENFDQEVGLVLKTSLKNNCIIDRKWTEQRLKSILSKHGDVKCKVYLLHGDLTEEEMTGLYSHSKIKCLISTTHGEGFGLPFFEAASAGLPVIAPDWSGHMDFMSITDKRNGKQTPLFSTVDYTLQNVQQEAVWDGVIQADSQWAFPEESSFKRRLREIRKDYDSAKKTANKLKRHVRKNFTSDIKNNEFVNSLLGKEKSDGYKIQKMSFCIPTNGARVEKTKLTINSIKKEMKELPYEIILVGAVDSFSDIEGITVIDRKEEASSRKVSSLRNAAADASTGDVIVWCDDDIILGPGWLSGVIKYNNGNLWNVLGCRILNPDGTRHWDRGTINPRSLVDYNFPSYSRNLMQTSGFFMVKRSVFEEVRWDESKLVHADRLERQIPEDLQYSIDVQRLGYNIDFNENSTVWHNDDNYTQIKDKTLTLSDIEKFYSMSVYVHHSEEYEATLGDLNV